MKEFDLEAVYDNEISPLMRKIIDICNEHEMPMICSFAYEFGKEETAGFCTTLMNGFEDKGCGELMNAAKVIRGESHSTMAITIRKSSDG